MSFHDSRNMDPVSPELDINTCNELAKYVDILTSSGEPELDDGTLKKLKGICRTSDGYVNHVYYLVMHRLEEDHAEIRLSSVQLINELFRRSHCFRELLVSNFQDFLELAVEINPDYLLPPPLPVAKKLKRLALQFIEQWHKQYSSGYKKLALGYSFLKECIKVDFGDTDARSVVERQQDGRQRDHKESLLKDKQNRAIQEMNDVQNDIADFMTQIQHCFELLIPSPEEGSCDVVDFDDPQPCCSTSTLLPRPSCGDSSATPLSCGVQSLPSGSNRHCTNDEGDEPTNLSKEEESARQNESDSNWLNEHGILSEKYKLTVEIKPAHFQVTLNEDNKPIVDNLKELFNLLKIKYLPLALKWVQVLGKGSSNQEMLKKAVNLKNLLKVINNKCELLNIGDSTMPSAIENKEDSSDDDFEEVPSKPGYEPIIPQHLRLEYGLEPLKPGLSSKKLEDHNWNLAHSSTCVDDINDPTSMAANVMKLSKSSSISISSPSKSVSDKDAVASSTHKSRLLSLAPKLRYDVDLFHWDEEKLTPPSVVRYDSLHKFWQPHENETEEIVHPEQVASLRERVMEFSGNFEPVQWSCRAPLPSGRLCPRKDRFKCPFHGKIIPRDNIGNPSNPEDSDRLKKLEEEAQQSNPEWQDKEFLKDLELATGVDLTVKKGKRKKKTQIGRGLTDIKASNNTTRKRLEKKVLNRATVKRVASTLDSIDHKKFKDKFGDQFNYAYLH